MTRILIIEDDLTIANFLQTALSRAGYEGTVVRHGSKAVQIADSLQPDLITLDLMLPGLDGIEICKLFRKDPLTAGTPVVMVTAKADDVDRAIGLAAGATDYLTKPFKIRELIKRIEELLHGKRLGIYDE